MTLHIGVRVAGREPTHVRSYVSDEHPTLNRAIAGSSPAARTTPRSSSGKMRRSERRHDRSSRSLGTNAIEAELDKQQTFNLLGSRFDPDRWHHQRRRSQDGKAATCKVAHARVRFTPSSPARPSSSDGKSTRFVNGRSAVRCRAWAPCLVAPRAGGACIIARVGLTPTQGSTMEG